nr:WhiB family transcriptional regulator [Streptacidiphilus jiangxiensis]
MERAWSWQEEAACARHEDRLFFHPAGERGRDLDNREKAAKRVCAECPVIASCRAYALAAREPYGVWGGLSENERAAALRRRPTSVAA